MLFLVIAEDGYFGDMTRTVLRGRASEAQRKLWRRESWPRPRFKEKSRQGSDGDDDSQGTRNFVAKQGFRLKCAKAEGFGFFPHRHGYLGLEIHEHPRLQEKLF